MTYALLSGVGAAPAFQPGKGLPGWPAVLPTKSELEAEVQPYVDIANAISPPPGFDPTNPDTWKPELVIPYGVRMAQEITKQLGLAPVDMSAITQIVKGDLKWLDDMGIPITSIPTNVRDLAMLFARTSAVAACKQLGIPPEIGTATVDALADGEFTSADVESIGGVAGGMGGSYICGLIGLPPQLGGYFGSMAGKFVGGVISDALSIGGGKAERAERRRQELAARAAVRKQLQSIRAQYQTLIVPLVRQFYWEMFDNMLEDLENFWEMTECTTGISGQLPPVRFPLLWGSSGMLQGIPSAVEPFLRHPYDASRCPPPRFNLSKDSALCLGPGFITPGTASGCPSMFGCPYPSFPALGAGGAERVAQAFAAYNVWWMQPSNRAANTEAWKAAMPSPPSNIVNAIARRTQERGGCKSDTCRRYADRDITTYVGQYNELLGSAVEAAGPNPVLDIGMRIQSDIVATGSVYRAAAALRAEKNSMRAGNMKRVRAIMDNMQEVSAARRTLELSRLYGSVANGALNFGLPALGAVMIGAAIFRKGR